MAEAEDRVKRVLQLKIRALGDPRQRELRNWDRRLPLLGRGVTMACGYPDELDAGVARQRTS